MLRPSRIEFKTSSFSRQKRRAGRRETNFADRLQVCTIGEKKAKDKGFVIDRRLRGIAVTRSFSPQSQGK